MSLLLATLLPGLLLVLLGAALLANNSGIMAMFKSVPRSNAAAGIFFGGGALWFLYVIWHLSPADFGDFRGPLAIAFGTIAALAFWYVPDFLSVRGLAVLMLLSASPLLQAGYMDFNHPQVYFQKVLVYVGICLAIWLGAQPWRLRDFNEWLFRSAGRARALGGGVLAYGLLLTVLAFTY